jgi:hypothetical protein
MMPLPQGTQRQTAHTRTHTHKACHSRRIPPSHTLHTPRQTAGARRLHCPSSISDVSASRCPRSNPLLHRPTTQSHTRYREGSRSAGGGMDSSSDHSYADFSNPKTWDQIGGALICVLCAALAAGLTVVSAYVRVHVLSTIQMAVCVSGRGGNSKVGSLYCMCRRRLLLMLAAAAAAALLSACVTRSPTDDDDDSSDPTMTEYRASCRWTRSSWK